MLDSKIYVYNIIIYYYIFYFARQYSKFLEKKEGKKKVELTSL